MVKKKAQGLITDITLYNFICEHENLNMFQIAKKLGWSSGKVQWSVKRLENENMIKSELIYNTDRPKRIIKPIKWHEKADKKELEIFKDIVSKLQ